MKCLNMKNTFLVVFLAVGIVNGHFFGVLDKLKKQADENQGKIWALLVAGSNTYINYRHQADICHAYQIIHAHGIPDEQIVVMMYDDIAYNSQNPTKGVIINHVNGSDVYKGVPKDYTGNDVNPQVFLNVLQGKKEAFVDGSKVIDSGPNDHVFVYFADHGAPGLIAFPNGELYSKQLNDAILNMHENKRYDKMVLYIEACESGSMFEGIIRNDINVYVTTAANPTESSYACYYDSTRETYLGDCYSVNWMEDSDKSDLTQRSLKDQFETVKTLTTTSHVQQYGDTTMGSFKLAEFQGRTATSQLVLPKHQSDAVAARQVPFEILKRRILAENDSIKKEQLKNEYNQKILKAKKTYSDIKQISLIASNYNADLSNDLFLTKSEHSYSLPFGCYEPVTKFFSKNCHAFGKEDFAESYSYVFINMCNAGISASRQMEVIKEVCSK